ncbi:hypothetical protein CCICO_02060 [Corynebacterium ciconiae DSM 44920]|uniref:hypothetical protein n=1 Tax=Corynebacterium ciconiae TaxID=227319 RepID=UPI000364D040|nr:hypothetical protein [Corynebacterium ciconiae]WKD60464.1 hypothetical protein CCICO_02060 [Corynebacterium ciconiae DSM 44920]
MDYDRDYFSTGKGDLAVFLDGRKYYAVTPIERGVLAFVVAAVCVSIVMGNVYLLIGFSTALVGTVVAVFFHPLRRRLRAMNTAEVSAQSAVKAASVAVGMWVLVFILIIIFSAWNPPVEWMAMVGYIVTGLCSIAATQLALSNV